jgi:hypothetical protein
VGLFLPVLLGPVRWRLLRIDIQVNMIGYYHTPLWDVFIGSLCTVGAFRFCYRGYARIESWAANLESLSALGVAVFPIESLTGGLRAYAGSAAATTSSRGRGQNGRDKNPRKTRDARDRPGIELRGRIRRRAFPQ